MKKRKARRERADVACRMPVRRGIDLGVLQFLKDVDTAFGQIRSDLNDQPGVVGVEDDAVKVYLIYLSTLVDAVLAGLVMNAVHGNDLLVLMLQRLLVEYAAKAEYYQGHPDFAVFMVRINEADSSLQRVKDGNRPPEEIARYAAHAKNMRERFSAYTNIPGVSVRQIMETVSRTEEWAWLYGAPSVLLHGEPEGMRTVYSVTNGVARTRVDVDNAYLNAHLVDAGMNALTFCRAFNKVYHDGHEATLREFAALERRGQELTLKHDCGRDLDALAEIRGAYDNATPC